MENRLVPHSMNLSIDYFANPKYLDILYNFSGNDSFPAFEGLKNANGITF